MQTDTKFLIKYFFYKNEIFDSRFQKNKFEFYNIIL